MNNWESQYTIDAKASDVKEKFVKWSFDKDYLGNKMIKLKFNNIISKVVWHSKGDYFATMIHNIQTSSQVMIHSLGRTTSTRPFSSAKGIV